MNAALDLADLLEENNRQRYLLRRSASDAGRPGTSVGGRAPAGRRLPVRVTAVIRTLSGTLGLAVLRLWGRVVEVTRTAASRRMR